MVDFAIEASRRVTRTTRELNEAKHHLREVGRNAGLQSVELEGNLGVASVVYERDQAKPIKGTDLKDIEENLSAETFAQLFVRKTVIQPARDFVARIGGLTPAELAVVNQFIEVKPTTPKVYLPK